MNLTCQGAQNLLLNGNPDMTFFKSAYRRYTDFGKQRFRIDHDGLRTASMTDATTFKFRVPRYADLLSDTYVSFSLPDIWSPTLVPPGDDSTSGSSAQNPVAYQFRWIPSVGTNAIRRVRISAGGVTIQEYTGDYIHTNHLLNCPPGKAASYRQLIGDVPELTKPLSWAPSWAYWTDGNGLQAAIALSRPASDPNTYSYPGYWYVNDINPVKYVAANFLQPTIPARQIYVPLSAWFCEDVASALPLVSLQYAEIQIEIELAPFRELWTTNDMDRLLPAPHGRLSAPNNKELNTGNEGGVAPNLNDPKQWYAPRMFLQPTRDAVVLGNSDTTTYTGAIKLPDSVGELSAWYDQHWPDTTASWDANVHLVAEYIFVSDNERRVFAARPQKYLYRDVFQHRRYDVTGTERIELTTARGMVSGWTWFFRRSTAYESNDWTNYTDTAFSQANSNFASNQTMTWLPDTLGGEAKPPQVQANTPIMRAWGLLIDGEYREDVRDADIFNWMEPYECSVGPGAAGLYSYNFGLKSGMGVQPTGAMNLAQCSKIEFEVRTQIPPGNPDAMVTYICDAAGGVVGVEQAEGNQYAYTYDLVVQEMRYNMLTFENGNVSLAFAR